MMRRVRFASRSTSKKVSTRVFGTDPMPCPYMDHTRQQVYDWLRKIAFHEYTDHFVDEGYELCTIAHMTTVDLEAIGINLPLHRRCLERHIASLIVWVDPFPTHVPDSVADWLDLLELPEYEDNFAECGFQSVSDLMRLNHDNLVQLGVDKPGHRKKLLLAIERVRKLSKPVVAQDNDPLEGDLDIDPFNCSSMQKSGQFLTMERRLKRPTAPVGILRRSPGRAPAAGGTSQDRKEAVGSPSPPPVPPRLATRGQPKPEDPLAVRPDPLGEEMRAKVGPKPKPQTEPVADEASGLKEVEQIVDTMLSDLEEMNIL